MTRAIILNNYPIGSPKPENITIINIQLPDCNENQIRVRTLFFSVDPYMRNRLRPEGTLYINAFGLGDVLVSMGIAEVMQSELGEFKVGDLVIGMLPWQEFAIIEASKVKPILKSIMPITTYLGIMGYPGLTAYVGIHYFAKPTPGQKIFISGAAGAVGSLAAQMAKLLGCNVVGSTSNKEKIDYLLDDLKINAAFNYKKYQNNYKVAFEKYCPEGIDTYFENVGGEMLEAVIEYIKPNSTIVLCGAISQYNNSNPKKGPVNFNQLVQKKLKLVGYIVTDYDCLWNEFQHYISSNYQNGMISYRETIIDGFENLWPAFISLFESKNIGKMLVSLNT